MFSWNRETQRTRTRVTLTLPRKVEVYLCRKMLKASLLYHAGHARTSWWVKKRWSNQDCCCKNSHVSSVCWGKTRKMERTMIPYEKFWAMQTKTLPRCRRKRQLAGHNQPCLEDTYTLRAGASDRQRRNRCIHAWIISSHSNMGTCLTSRFWYCHGVYVHDGCNVCLRCLCLHLQANMYAKQASTCTNIASTQLH